MKTTSLIKIIGTSVGTFACLAVTIASETTNSVKSEFAMRIVNVKSAQELVRHSDETNALVLGGTNSVVSLEVVATNYEFHGAFHGNTNSTLSLVEFQIKSKNGTPFTWFCWESEYAYPHDFRLFTTVDGLKYACYTSSGGVRLFHVSTSVDSEAARQLHLEGNARPGELPPLRNGVIFDAVGEEAFKTPNALYWPINVDNVYQGGGELRATLHGDKPEPHFTFALRKDKWELVSTSGK